MSMQELFAPMKRAWIICDIDGTIADMTRRVSLMPDWDAVHEDIDNDPPYSKVIELVTCLADTYFILFMTGRNARFRTKTVKWFEKMNIQFHADVIMRPDDNYQTDPELKWTLATQYFKTEEGVRHSVFMVIEDRDKVVEMWRNKGLFCIQPRIGDY